MEKRPILDQNHELTSFEKSKFFDFLHFLFLQPRKTFFGFQNIVEHNGPGVLVRFKSVDKIFSAPFIGFGQCGSVVGRPRENRIRKVWVQGPGFSLSCGGGFWRSLDKNNVKETSTKVFNKLHHTLLLRNTLTKMRAKIQLHHSRTRKPRKPI